MCTRIRIEVLDGGQTTPNDAIGEDQVSARSPRTGEVGSVKTAVDFFFGHVLFIVLVEFFQPLEFNSAEHALVTTVLVHYCVHLLGFHIMP